MKRDVYERRAEALQQKLARRRNLANMRRLADDPEFAKEAGLAWLREFRAAHGLPDPEAGRTEAHDA